MHPDDEMAFLSAGIVKPQQSIPELLPDDQGWRVKTTSRCRVEVHIMAFGTLRVCEVVDGEIERCWDYAPSEIVPPALNALTVLAKARDWDGGEHTEPTGWVRQVGTGRRRPNGDPELEYIAD